ncbi:MAG: ABC transporter permease [Firmicutes bacterium]|nr:ABC transporter permease [Bacillota bacterium]
MRFLLGTAVANLRRQKRRNLLTGLMIFLGAFNMVMAFSYGQSVEQALTNGAVKGLTGHLQIRPYSEGKIEVMYLEKDGSFLTATGRLQELLLTHPATVAVTPRLTFWGILAGESAETGVAMAAVDPATDPLVFPGLKVTKGSFLTRRDGLLLSESTARTLGVKPGDELLLLTQTPDEYLNGINLVVEGLVKAEGISLFVDYFAYMGITAARDLLYLPEDSSSFLAVSLAPGVKEKTAAAVYRSLTAQEGWQLRVDPWREVAGILNGVIMAAKFLPGVGLGVILLVIAAGIANALLISLLERTKEIGTLMALGTKRREVLGLFLLETGILSGIAAGLGVFAGGVVVFLLGRIGIPAPVEAMEFAFGGPRLYYVFSLPVLVVSFVAIVLFSLAVAVFPARRAAALTPVEALREE